MTRPPVNTWLIARQPVYAPYACRCWLGRPCRTTGGLSAYWCPCWGRTDHLDLMPAYCCARRAQSTLENA